MPLSHSEPLQQQSINDLIGKPPTWILRSGISIIGLFSIITILLSNFIAYPDRVSSHGVMTAAQPPVSHHAAMTGVIDSLFFREGDHINQGEIVAYLYNSATLKDILAFKSTLEQLDTLLMSNTCVKEKLSKEWRLGALQGDFSRLQLMLEELCQEMSQQITHKQIKALENEKQYIEDLQKVIHEDRALQQKELDYVYKDEHRQDKLWLDKVISDLDHERSKLSVIQYEKSLNNTNLNLMQNEIRINTIQQEIFRLREERNQLILTLKLKIQEQILYLYGLITVWEQQYLIIALTEGILSFYPEIIQGKYLSAGESVFTILPQPHADKFVRVFIPTQEMIRIEKGSKAIIKFDAYPYKQWGVIESQVDFISKTPFLDKEGLSQYELQINLPADLVTTYGNRLSYKALDGASVDIITEDRSILTRIFDQFLNLINNPTL